MIGLTENLQTIKPLVLFLQSIKKMKTRDQPVLIRCRIIVNDAGFSSNRGQLLSKLSLFLVVKEETDHRGSGRLWYVTKISPGWTDAITSVPPVLRCEGKKQEKATMVLFVGTQRGGHVSAILYLFLTVNFGCHTRSLEDLKKGGRMEGGVQLQKILSLFISVIRRLWWFSSTKLQQHRKHEHKSAQITENVLASMEGLKE